jgi:hypothetical protein
MKEVSPLRIARPRSSANLLARMDHLPGWIKLGMEKSLLAQSKRRS